MASSTLSMGFALKTASASVAMVNAKNFIVLVGKGNKSADVPIALSLVIPVASLTANSRYWMVSDSYNTDQQCHLQVRIGTLSYSNLGLYYGANIISDATYEWYYC